MPVPVKMADLYTIAASNSPAGSDPIGNSLDDYLRATQAIIRSTNALASATIAASSTVDLGSADAESVQITGAATITSFGTVSAGIVRECRFTGVCTITNSSSIALPGATNITTAAGDILTFRSLGSGNWALVNASNDYNSLRTTGGTLTGPLTINETASPFALTIGSTGTSGAGLKLIGDGSTTPSKYIRARAGNLEFVNDANSTVIATMSDVGSLTIGALTVSGASTFNGTPTINSAGSEADLFLQYGNSSARRVYFSNTSSGTRFGINYTDASGNYLGTGLAMDNTTGNISIPTNLSVTGTIQSNSNSTSAMMVGNGGNLRIVGGSFSRYLRTNPSNGWLEIVNSAYSVVSSYLTDGGVWSATDFQSTSDARIKTNIRELNRGLDELKRMPPREYEKEGRRELGFLAQEALKVVPEAVNEGVDGLLLLSYGQITALIAAAVLDIDRRLTAKGI